MTIPNLLTASEVADILQVSPRTLASWRANSPDDLPFVRIGDRTVRYRRDDVEDFIAYQDIDDDDSDDDDDYDD